MRYAITIVVLLLFRINGFGTTLLKQGTDIPQNDFVVPCPVDSLIHAYMERGRIKSESGDKLGAIAEYNKAIEIDSNYAVAYYKRGNENSDLGNNKDAIADYSKAIEIMPDYAFAYSNRGTVKAALGDHTGAITDSRAKEELINQQPIEEHQLPKGITYSGTFKGAIQYFDKSGEHVTLITENTYSGSVTGEGFANAELYAYHFDVNESNSVTQTWKVYDFYKECPVDVIAEFLENTFQITDLDNNGIAEIWLVYIQGCKGDISPWNMKIIMYQGEQKFAMRGMQKIVYMSDGRTHEYGGEYKFDDAFNAASKVFRDFAEKLWESNCEDRLGE